MSPTGNVPNVDHSGDTIARAGQVLFVVYENRAWADTIRELKADGFDCQSAPATGRGTDILARLQVPNVVLVLDLAPDPVHAMATLAAVRRQAPLVPVVVVAHDPSIEFARRIRLAGVFYMALDPVGVDEMRSVLASAFKCLGRARTGYQHVPHETPRTHHRRRRRLRGVDDGAARVAGLCGVDARNAKEGLEKVLDGVAGSHRARRHDGTRLGGLPGEPGAQVRGGFRVPPPRAHSHGVVDLGRPGDALQHGRRGRHDHAERLPDETDGHLEVPRGGEGASGRAARSGDGLRVRQ